MWFSPAWLHQVSSDVVKAKISRPRPRPRHGFIRWLRWAPSICFSRHMTTTGNAYGAALHIYASSRANRIYWEWSKRTNSCQGSHIWYCWICTKHWFDLIWNTVHQHGLHTTKRTSNLLKKFIIDLEYWFPIWENLIWTTKNG